MDSGSDGSIEPTARSTAPESTSMPRAYASTASNRWAFNQGTEANRRWWASSRSAT